MTRRDSRRDIGLPRPQRAPATDGNVLAGTLEALFGADMTAVPARCAHCDTVNAVGAMRAYVRAPGAVLGCPACDEVVPRMVETVNATYFDARGASYLRFDRR